MNDQGGITIEKLEDLVLSDAFREMVRLFDKRPPNVFRVAGISHREVYLSKVVAWLLNPAENHHLGDRPLRSLLLRAAEARRRPAQQAKSADTLSVEEVYGLDLGNVRVQTEYPIRDTDRDRRLDILIESPSAKLLVVIENKIWAHGCEGKQSDYAEWAQGRKEYDKAITDYTRVIELDPNYAAAYCNRGYAYAMKKEYDMATTDFKKCIELSDDPSITKYAEDNLKKLKELKQ